MDLPKMHPNSLKRNTFLIFDSHLMLNGGGSAIDVSGFPFFPLYQVWQYFIMAKTWTMPVIVTIIDAMMMMSVQVSEFVKICSIES